MLSELWKKGLRICSGEGRGAGHHAKVIYHGVFNSLTSPLMSEAYKILWAYKILLMEDPKK